MGVKRRGGNIAVLQSLKFSYNLSIFIFPVKHKAPTPTPKKDPPPRFLKFVLKCSAVGGVYISGGR